MCIAAKKPVSFIYRDLKRYLIALSALLSLVPHSSAQQPDPVFLTNQRTFTEALMWSEYTDAEENRKKRLKSRTDAVMEVWEKGVDTAEKLILYYDTEGRITRSISKTTETGTHHEYLASPEHYTDHYYDHRGNLTMTTSHGRSRSREWWNYLYEQARAKTRKEKKAADAKKDWIHKKGLDQEEISPDDTAAVFSYDSSGYPVSCMLRYEGIIRVSYKLNEKGLVKEILTIDSTFTTGDLIHTYEYDHLGRIIRMERGSLGAEPGRYDPHKTHWTFVYSYDTTSRPGRLITHTEVAEDRRRYDYNKFNELVEERILNNKGLLLWQTKYTYDEAGRLSSRQTLLYNERQEKAVLSNTYNQVMTYNGSGLVDMIESYETIPPGETGNDTETDLVRNRKFHCITYTYYK